MPLVRDTSSDAAGLKHILPGLELVIAFGSAALVMFAVIFSISAAVMTPPRDVRLATEPHLTVTPSAKSAAAVKNAAIESKHAVR